jgi:hypothetical protein
LLCAAAVDDAMDMLSVLDTGAPFGVTAGGLKLQLVPAGNPEQLRLTGILNPFCGLIVTVKMPISPRVTLMSELLTAMVYPGVPAEATVIVMALDIDAACDVSPL